MFVPMRKSICEYTFFNTKFKMYIRHSRSYRCFTCTSLPNSVDISQVPA